MSAMLDRARDAARALAEPTTTVGWQHHAVLAVVLVVVALLLVTSLPRTSPTADETYHLACGLGPLTQGDTVMNYQHPPLGNIYTALPAALFDEPLDLETFAEWRELRPFALGHAIARADYPRVRRQLTLGRLAMIGLALALIAWTYRWTLRRWGWPTAVLTSCLMAFNPTALAHGRLVTTDLPITLLTVVAVGELIAYLESPTWHRLATLSLATGAALATKYSAVGLGPIILIWSVHHAWRARGRFAGLAPWQRVRRLVLDGVVVCLTVLVVINAAYGFQRTGWSVERILAEPEPNDWAAVLYDEELLEEMTPLDALPRWLPVPLPYPYLFGLGQLRAHDHLGHGGWFRGEFRSKGWRSYFTILLLVKTPVPILLLVAATPFLLLRRGARPVGVGVLLSAAATWVALASLSQLNLGVRHVLPAIACLTLVAGAVAGRLLATRGWLRWIGPALAVVVVVTAFVHHPRYLGYFNVLAGGRSGGHEISIVSEDWGQAVVDLATAVRERSLTPLRYAPYYEFHATELRYLGVDFESFECGETDALAGSWVAVHANMQRRFVGKCYAWSADLEPTLVVNDHVFVYDLRDATPRQLRDPAKVLAEAREAQAAKDDEKCLAVLADLHRFHGTRDDSRFVQAWSLHRLDRLPEAIGCYRLHLDEVPDDPFALFNLSFALAAEGRQEAAVHELERVLELDPSFVVAHRALANAHAALGNEERAAFHDAEAKKNGV